MKVEVAASKMPENSIAHQSKIVETWFFSNTQILVVLVLASCGNVCKGCDRSAWPAVAASTSSSNSSSQITMVKTFQAYLPQCHRTYSCIHCRAHLANHDELISKSFQGSQGRAYLFNSVVNVGCGPAEERVLLTGLHAVADIYCECCKTTLGWKYEHAFESSQKYKEGKFIIELAHMIKENGWD
nr:protein yippee-like 2 isoform X1 [Leptinotarsa decemlineata]